MFIKFKVLKHKRNGENPSSYDRFNMQNYKELDAYIRKDGIKEFRQALVGADDEKVLVTQIDSDNGTYTLNMKMEEFLDRYGNDIMCQTAPKNFRTGGKV